MRSCYSSNNFYELRSIAIFEFKLMSYKTKKNQGQENV